VGILLADVFAYKENGDRYVEVIGGWADEGDKTSWEGFIFLEGIVVG
jgi:hypothetical protein